MTSGPIWATATSAGNYLFALTTKLAVGMAYLAAFFGALGAGVGAAYGATQPWLSDLALMIH